MKSTRAIWNGVVIAESESTVMVEGNHYFPKSSVHLELLQPSELTTNCPWKGVATYYSVVVDGQENKDAAWTYLEPHPEALMLKDHFAFWKGIDIVHETEAERNSRFRVHIEKFVADVSSASNLDDQAYVSRTSQLLDDLGSDGLTHLLPSKYIENLAFFNFYNSNNVCFHTDRDFVIRITNPTFDWALNHLPDLAGSTLQDLMSHLEVVEGKSGDEFFKTLDSHGWARIPVLRLEKGGKSVYYSLDIAINKHGDKESLTGYQGQLIDITSKVELAMAVEKSKANMNSLLAGLNEGLFYFDETGAVAAERSQALASILPGSPDCTTIFDFADRYSKVDRGTVTACLELLWNQDEDDAFSVDFQSAITMLPKTTTIDRGEETRHVTFEYRRILAADDSLEKVICIVADVTDVLRNEREAKRQAERVRQVTKAAANGEGFLNFVKEISSIAASASRQLVMEAADMNQAELKRALHTLKGSAATYEFAELASKIHSLEDIIGEGGLDDRLDACRVLWQRILELWAQQTEDIKQVLGLSENSGRVVIARHKIDRLREHAEAGADQTLTSMVANLECQLASEIFGKYESYLQNVAQRDGFKQVRFDYPANCGELKYEEIQKLDGALVHIFRNCLDHGIEEFERRRELGKPDVGTISIAVGRDADGLLQLNISDDGAGIDANKLADKAVEKGLWTADQRRTASDQDCLELIFASGLSSKDAVSSLSGRGVGMDAVRSTIVELGGTIDVETKLGRGSVFTIRVP